MKFRSVKEAVAWAYEYLDCSRSAKSPNLDPEKFYTPAKPGVHAESYGDRLLAIKILDYFGGWVEPDVAIRSQLGYFVGWIRWGALNRRERFQVRKTTEKLREELENEGVLDKKNPPGMGGESMPRG
jgi:hypothetical protein